MKYRILTPKMTVVSPGQCFLPSPPNTIRVMCSYSYTWPLLAVQLATCSDDQEGLMVSS